LNINFQSIKNKKEDLNQIIDSAKQDACGAPKLLLSDVSFIKLQLFVVLNDMSV
jgi:hypothetical protein